MSAPPRLRGGIAFRSATLVVGLFLFASGIVLLLESRLGLSPWDVLNQGVAKHSPLSFGAANIAVGLVVLFFAWRLRAPVGPGTVANAILIGLFVDLLTRIGSLNRLSDTSLLVRIVLLVAGIAVIGLGSALYIGAAFGAGPRDSLMLGVSDLSGVRIGGVRAALELAVTVGGFLLDGTVGVGTLAFGLGIGPALELSFYLLARSPLGEQPERRAQQGCSDAPSARGVAATACPAAECQAQERA
jgi:uncharacterized membrane protein YczE